MAVFAAAAALGFLVPGRGLLQALPTRASQIRSDTEGGCHPYDCRQHDTNGIRVRLSPAVHSRSLSRAASGSPLPLSVLPSVVTTQAIACRLGNLVGPARGVQLVAPTGQATTELPTTWRMTRCLFWQRPVST